ncbi:MAG: hypothetical protein JO125_11565 [Chloroflexi bacterium]|nr:hypothetical protein [Ktedonobacteraceae bacterium]MBV9708031.1 hypothetical protein [Chloroflexota bacterium]
MHMLLLLSLSLAFFSCSPGHNGSNEIAFLRAGHLWTIDPDGANAFEVVAQDTAVIGYSWSPTHQIFAFRALDADFAKTATAKQLTSNPITGLLGDAPSSINTVGIDGGSPIPTMLSSTDTLYSNPIWNPTGTRLVYRQESSASSHPAGNAFWWIAQNDQPVGIATQLLPSSYSVPSFAYTDSLAAGNSRQGLFTVRLDGTHLRYLVHGTLLGHPLSASLERILWQPAHRHPSLLYATKTESSTRVAITLYDTATDRTKTLVTCNCTQFAWSPDGNAVLYSTSSSYTVLHLDDDTSTTIIAEQGSVPYWSPDSKFLLLDGPHGLLLVQIAEKQQQVIFTDLTASVGPASSVASADANTLLQPVTNSPWAADSRHFLFLTHSRLSLQGHALKPGLYTIALDTHGRLQEAPTFVDGGNDTQAAWTYQDANTSFLY